MPLVSLHKVVKPNNGSGLNCRHREASHPILRRLVLTLSNIIRVITQDYYKIRQLQNARRWMLRHVPSRLTHVRC